MQTYKIAGLVVEMDVRYERLKNQAKAYLYSGKEKPNMTLILEEEALLRAKKRFPNVSDENLEYLLYGILFYDRLLDFDGMMLHASAVAIDKRAYLFSANSGTGKSTHTAYWTELFKEAVIVNDDKPAIRIEDGQLYVYGTPFSGKHDKSVNGKFLLGGICFLERGEENIIEGISPAAAIQYMLRQTISSPKADRVAKKLFVMDKVLSNAKLYKMQCTNDISAARVSFEKMKVSMPVRLLQLLPVMEEALSSGGAVTFTTHGKSMRPLLNNGDSVTVKKADKYKVGDVILFRKEDGSFVVHSIIKIKKGLFYTQGDSLHEKDEPIKIDNILGKVVEFIYPNKKVSINDFKFKVYKVLYMSPVARALRILKHKIVKNKKTAL